MGSDSHLLIFVFPTLNTTQPFYGSLDFVRDNPGEPVPEVAEIGHCY